jgi:uncharacterized membrane-anchored protein
MRRRFVDRVFHPITDEHRDSEIQRNRLGEGMTDFLLRLTELILVCGAVAYVERRLGAKTPYVSYVVAGIVGIYAHFRATAGMLSLMAEHRLDPRRQRLFYWLIIAFAFALWLAIAWFANAVVPLIANVQGGSS